MNIDIGLSKLEEITPKLNMLIGCDLSETDTRSKIIDQILIEVLGWTESHITREPHEEEGGGYIDYVLSTSRPILIVEAKKAFVDFDLPKGNTRFFRISGAISKCANAIAAIKQAKKYAINKGIIFCCISNGFQWLIFRSHNDQGVNWDNHFVSIFRSLEDIIKRFSEFYEMMSYESHLEFRAFKSIPLHILDGSAGFLVGKACDERIWLV